MRSLAFAVVVLAASALRHVSKRKLLVRKSICSPGSRVQCICVRRVTFECIHLGSEFRNAQNLRKLAFPFRQLLIAFSREPSPTVAYTYAWQRRGH